MNESFPLVVANFKANKTWDELALWLDVVGSKASEFPGTIIVCPTAAFLASSYQKLKTQNSKLILGTQDISRFEQGAYTGELAASQIADLVKYSIIGHSERRQNFAETDEVLAQKVKNAQAANIVPIFCVQDENTSIPDQVTYVAYEPIFAIGTGNPDTPQNAQMISAKLRARGDYIVIYGGSVNAQNAPAFLKKGVIDGLLIATSSLDPQTFIQVVQNSTQ